MVRVQDNPLATRGKAEHVKSEGKFFSIASAKIKGEEGVRWESNSLSHGDVYGPIPQGKSQNHKT